MTDQQFESAEFKQGDKVFYLGIFHEIEIVYFVNKKIGARSPEGKLVFRPITHLQHVKSTKN